VVMKYIRKRGMIHRPFIMNIQEFKSTCPEIKWWLLFSSHFLPICPGVYLTYSCRSRLVCLACAVDIRIFKTTNYKRIGFLLMVILVLYIWESQFLYFAWSRNWFGCHVCGARHTILFPFSFPGGKYLEHLQQQ
jgi:hypothetical protein